MADTFISYASEDRHRVQQIAVSLEAEGWTVWWDRELVGGTAFDEVIERELDTAGCVIVCWSKIATESQWVRDEAEEARSRGVIVPVRLEDVRVPLRFRRLHNLDLISWDGSTTAPAFRQVVEAVTRIVGPPPAPVLTEGVEEDSGPDASATAKIEEPAPDEQPDTDAGDVRAGVVDQVVPGQPDAPAVVTEPDVSKPSPQTPEGGAEPSERARTDERIDKRAVLHSGLRWLVYSILGLLIVGGVAWLAMLGPLSRPADLSVFRDRLKDGTDGPEMVVIPSGTFTMGSPSTEPDRDDNEGPRREVSIESFAVGKYEVTFAEYDRFAEETGRPKPKDRGRGRDDRPVVFVSWEDARDYAEWLSEQTGKSYRLPTEAEWEYAARAGTDSPFWTGKCIHTDQANYMGTYDYNDCGAKTDVYRAQTLPVGSLPANGFGLHETAGNVREWVEDCWHDNYIDAPDDGSAWLETEAGICDRRVLRGGAWSFGPLGLRSAYRYRDSRDDGYSYVGFRLAQDL